MRQGITYTQVSPLRNAVGAYLSSHNLKKKRKESLKSAWQAPDRCQINLMKHSATNTNPFPKLPFTPLKPLPFAMSGCAKA